VRKARTERTIGARGVPLSAVWRLPAPLAASIIGASVTVAEPITVGAVDKVPGAPGRHASRGGQCAGIIDEGPTLTGKFAKPEPAVWLDLHFFATQV
jgi:hypothetical protein